MLKPLEVEIKDNIILFKHKGDDDIVYKTQKNVFLADSGVTISNPEFDIPAYYIALKNFGTSIICGHIIDNIVGYLKNAELENILLIVDFDDIVEISDNFSESFVRFILSSKSKILYINCNTNINYALSDYIESIIDIQELEE